VLPLRHEDDRLVVAMHDPNDIHVLEDLAIIAGCQIRPVVASEDDLEGAFAHLFGTATLDESEGPLPAPERDADSAVSAVGEETGDIDGMLTKIAEFYESEVDAAVKALTSIIEPLMIAVVGGIVGGIIIAMYLPMFKIFELIE